MKRMASVVVVALRLSTGSLGIGNPKCFVPNIFEARPGDYGKATQRVGHE